jgi:ribulose 1,5-bisphosphate synthetase/thiazole synthase
MIMPRATFCGSLALLALGALLLSSIQVEAADEQAPAIRPSLGFVREPARDVPVAYDVDVVVAGGGISGVFAALAAAREGARTVLIDRFGYVGGSFGPGMMSQQGPVAEHGDAPASGPAGDPVQGGLAGLPKEFGREYFTLGPGTPERFLADSNKSAYVALKMLKEAGVTLMLSAYVADPIMEGDRVCGVFVENKSGRQAVKSRVVIDATGEADVARRAGTPVLQPKAETYEVDHHSPTGMGIWAVVAGIDPARFKGMDASEFGAKKDIDGLAQVGCGGLVEIGPERHTRGVKAQLVRPHPKVDAGNAEHISLLEVGVRMYVFDFVQHCRKHVPGCEDAYLLFVAPYLGCRGGPCIEGEYTLTMQDCREGKRFDDVIYRYGEPRAFRWMNEHGRVEWTDVPYRVMIPKKTDGLIAVGRSASGIPDTLLRNREGVMYMGQAGGTAAAMSARSGIEPRALDVKQLQRQLLKAGFYLGDKARLAELGLGD